MKKHLHTLQKRISRLVRPVRLTRLDRRTIKLNPADVACFLVVRNEEERLPYLLNYYREHGIAQFFVVENASTDGTRAFLLTQPDVALWFTNASFRKARCGTDWTLWLLRRYGMGRWCLVVDADELLYYPNSERRSIPDLCTGLEAGGYEAMAAIMLDMYSDRPIHETTYTAGQPFLEVCPFFDRQFYHVKLDRFYNHTHPTSYFGGMRQRVFGNDPLGQYGEHFYTLNKVPLFKYQSTLEFFDNFHWTSCTRLAAETGTLLHFKYFASFIRYAEGEVARKEHWNGGIQYANYQAKLKQRGDLVLFDPEHSIRFQNSQQLVELGIMTCEDIRSQCYT